MFEHGLITAFSFTVNRSVIDEYARHNPSARFSTPVCCDDPLRFWPALPPPHFTLKRQITMQRRQFIKNSVLLSAAGLVGPSVVSQTVQAAEPAPAPVARRRFVLSQTYKLNPPQGSSGVVKLWIPLPVDTAFQQMTNLTFSGTIKKLISPPTMPTARKPCLRPGRNLTAICRCRWILKSKPPTGSR